jgi:hypothetical protein
MEQLPNYIAIVFVLCTIFTVFMLYKASAYSKTVIILLIAWLVMQGIISLDGFYTHTLTVPPRFGLLLIPPVIFIIMLFLTKKGRSVIDAFNVRLLNLLQVVRIFVELGLYSLYLHKVVPQLITFEGSNFDILCGLSAPLIYYFGYVKNVLNKKVLIAWNIACLLLLANVVVMAVLSAPFPFQRFGFGQPNIAMLYFPFVWLPCCIVPAALFAHLAAIRKLVKG